MNNVPFPSAYWVVPDKLMAGGFPGSTDEQARKMKLNGLIKIGIKAVVNLMEEKERNYQGQFFDNYAPALEMSGVETKRFPIKDLSVPSVQLMTAILDSIDEFHRQGKIVYIHCWGGVGRTGTVIGCYLIRHRLANSSNIFDMIKNLKKSTSIAERQSPETNEQRLFVMNWK